MTSKTGASPPPSSPDRGRAAADQDTEVGCFVDSDEDFSASVNVCAADLLDEAEGAYEIEELIAEGSEGRVFVVRDNAMRRRVAMKVMHRADGEYERTHRFIAEARRTGSLHHASIPPVYDLGYTAGGEPYFTMRLIEGRTLAHVLRSVRKGEQGSADWTLVKLAQILQQVAYALDYAHNQGLIHRDLKPANIGLGEYEEVLVLDWGLSKRIGEDCEEAAEGPLDDLQTTQLGAVKGTPRYMSPEQAWGYTHLLDARTDVFSLGAILYQILCWRAPHAGRTVHDVVLAARRCEIVPPDRRCPERELPSGLVETAMRALSRDASDRQESAREFAMDLQAFIDGRMERETRKREAATLLATGLELLENSRRLSQQAEELKSRAKKVRSEIGPGDAREFWKLEDASEQALVESVASHAGAMDAVAQALSRDPHNVSARQLKASLYFERFVKAESRGDRLEAAWLRRMVERYHVGRIDEAIRDGGHLMVVTMPAGANVRMSRYVERRRRMLEEEDPAREQSPAAWGPLATGSYLVRVDQKGYVPARVPVLLERGQQAELTVFLASKASVPKGFICVSGGPFLTGVRPNLQEVDVPGFLIDRKPVRLYDYAHWLEELHAADPMEAKLHVPWVEAHGPLLRVDDDGKFVFCPASPIARRPISEHPELPVVGVSRDSAALYAAWLGERLGFSLRLPTELEWQKAARGCDGRQFPWGDRFEPAFCSMSDTPAVPANLRPIGICRADVSPYGVLDMAGGVREWCSDDVDAGCLLAVCRGGAWYARADECAVTSRWLLDASTKNSGVGFRLCSELPAATISRYPPTSDGK